MSPKQPVWSFEMFCVKAVYAFGHFLPVSSIPVFELDDGQRRIPVVATKDLIKLIGKFAHAFTSVYRVLVFGR